MTGYIVGVPMENSPRAYKALETYAFEIVDMAFLVVLPLSYLIFLIMPCSCISQRCPNILASILSFISKP